MEEVLFDTNVILDIALKRLPHFDDAAKLFELIDQKKIVGHITASTITDIYYISKREKGHIKTLEFISNLIEVVDVIGVDKGIIMKALNSEMNDFEDAVQVSAAKTYQIDSLITRNKKDFSNSEMKVYTPNEFLNLRV